MRFLISLKSGLNMRESCWTTSRMSCEDKRGGSEQRRRRKGISQLEQSRRGERQVSTAGQGQGQVRSGGGF